MKIALTRQFPGSPEETLKDYFEEVRVADQDRPLRPDELAALVKGTDVIICSLPDRIDSALLSAADSVKCVISFSTGVDHIDLDEAKKRGVRVGHISDILSEATADLAWLLILACARRFKPAIRYLEEGKFNGFGPALLLGLELRGSTLGIVGMGRIGTAVARRAVGFGVKVLYTGGSGPKSVNLPADWVPLEGLLRLSDIVSLHCPLTEATHHMIGTRELRLMKKEGILVNTARGPLIDESALLAHLKTHPEFSAGLDVFEQEPCWVSPELVSLPNSVCLPHVGSATHKTRLTMTEACVAEAIRFANGDVLKNEVI